MSERTKIATSALAIAASAFAASAALAQSAADDDRTSGVEEIVVTAQKRSENLQKVPISVAAITADTATALGVTDTTDLQFATPGLVMHHQGFSLAPVLRGISTQGGGSPPEESPIAIYVDGVYMVTPASGVFSLNNIDRIEVLKGPQGTLFGRNAVGGVISVITAAPKDTPEVKASVGYANYDTYEASFYGTTGVATGVATDLAVFWSHQSDGWGKHVAAPGQVNPVLGKPTYINRDFAVRNKWLLTPGDTTRISIAADYYKGQNATGTARSLLPGTFAANNVIRNDTGRIGGFWDIRSDQYKQTAYYKNYGASVTLDQEINDLNFRSITAYRRTFVEVNGDQDSVEVPVFNANNKIEARPFSQELQLLSSDDSSFKWIAGLYYMHVNYRDNSNYTGTLFGPTGTSFQRLNSRATTTSVAAFGEVTVSLGEQTHATGGVRYTSDRQAIEGFVFTAAGITANSRADQKKTFSEPTWRLAIDHQLNPSMMAYASYNRGFKSGVYTTTAATNPPARPTTVDAYEIGLKSQLFDNRVRLNVAGFYSDSKDIQLQVFEPNGTGLRLLNATSGTAKGIDVELEAVPVQNLTLRLGGEYLDAKYKNFPNAPVYVPNAFGVGGLMTVRRDVSGTPFLYSPKWSGNASVVYDIPTSVGDINLAVNYYYQSSFLGGFDSFKQPSYDLWNASVGWTSSDERWNFKVWGKNLGNEKYYNHLTASNRRAAGSPGAPRTYGITLGMKWHG